MDERLMAISREKGVFSRKEALEVGYSDRAIAGEVRAGRWKRVRRGAFTSAGTWDALDIIGRHQVLARAVLRNARCTAALSHTSALAELGASCWELPLGLVHLARFDDRAGRREAGVVQHHGAMYVGDLTCRNGLLVSSPTRTALDITTIADTEHSLVPIDNLLHRKETTIEEMRHRALTMNNWPDTLKTDLVLRLADGRSESPGETRARYLCWKEGLPAPVPQYEVLSGGSVVARLDLAWPELGVWLEFDGALKYSALLRQGESPADAVLREKRREDDIRRVTGWRCIRVTWAELYEPQRLAAKIRQLFADQAAA